MGGSVRVQSRKWQITINNPLEHGFDHDRIKESLGKLKGLVYWCMCDEEGDECETRHTHIYVQTRSAITADRVNNLFPNFHREKVHGTAKENRAYVFKDGDKFNKDETGHYSYQDSGGRLHEGINFSDTAEEAGELPDEHQGKSSYADLIVNMIREGASDTDIVDTVSSAYCKLEHIQQTRSMFRSERFKKEWRDLHVVYIFGKTGLGKTRSVMDAHGYENVFRVTDYRHYPFDDYECEDVLMFEEYRSDIKIGDMLKYLDGYPLRLPARFKNKQACYTQVYIVTNIPPEDQYRNVDADSVAAFWRRVNEIWEYTPEGSVLKYPDLDKYKHRYEWLKDALTASPVYLSQQNRG